MPPSPEKKPDPANEVDINKILLPQKEEISPAERINAGVLLQQEQTAELPKVETPVVDAPAPKEERPEVSPLQTYKGDVERAVEDRGVSVVSVAAAEAERRGKEGQTPEAKKEARKIFGMSLAMIIGGVLLIVVALAAVAFILLRPTAVEAPLAPVAPFMSVDETIYVWSGVPNRDALVTNITAGVRGAKLSLGLIGWLYIGPQAADGSYLAPLTTQELLGIVAPDLPAELARTLRPTHLFGVHSFDENQAFLLLEVDSYETAYRGMLEWEYTMRADLNPIFTRDPSPKPVVEEATSTQATSTPQFIQTGFVDKVVENRDARVVLDKEENILLLWTMLGRNIILITTNEYTLREVISRMSVAPVVPIPGR